MSERVMIRFLAGVVLLLASGAAFSAQYSWKYQRAGSTTYPSALEACVAFGQQYWPPSSTYTYLSAKVDLSGANGTCTVIGGLKTNPSSTSQGTSPLYRDGDSCPANYQYNPTTGGCDQVKPTDAECKTREAFTKVVQFSFVDGQAVIGIDPEVKDQCIYEPGEPQNCTSVQCEFEMTPTGNDDMSDNPDNPDQQLQDYLDELAKQFDCVKTVNGTVGCTNAQQTPPDIDPEDKCFPGYSWSGTTCVATPGGPAENNNSGSGSGGGNSGGNNGGGSDGGTNPGTGGGDGGSDGGGTSGGGSDNGSDGGDGPSESLEQPKQGNWDEALVEWDNKVEAAKEQFRDKIRENADQLKGVFDLNLGEGGGKLPCDTFTVWKKPVTLCFTAYEEKLSYLRYALMFMASVLAAFAILKE